MAKTNKQQPKNAAAEKAAKTVSAKAKPTKVVAKVTKASPVSKSAATNKKTASPLSTNTGKGSAAKVAPKTATPAKVASPSSVKVNPATAKTAVAKVAVAKASVAPVAKAPVVKPALDKAPAKAALDQKAPVAKVAVAPRPPVATSAQPQRAMLANGSKAASERISSPVTAAAVARPVQAAVPSQPKPAPSAVQAAVDPLAPKKPITTRHGFKTNELIVYPAHGVGRIIGIEEQEIAGISLELFVIEFEKDKMTLRVPTSKLVSVGMRKLAEDGVLKRAMETLKGKARIKRTMWSRRAQEYEAKINSGDLVSIAEVVRDLYRSEAQPEQSYSERQLYEAALDRMSRELAAVDKSDERSAMQRITEILSKSAKGRRAVEEEAQAAAAGQGEVKAA